MEDSDFIQQAFAGMTPEQRADEIGSTLWPLRNYDARFIKAAKEMLARHIRYAIAEEREACAEVAEAVDSGRGNEASIARFIRERGT